MVLSEKKQYLCIVKTKKKTINKMTTKQKAKAVNAAIWWSIVTAIDAAVISEWVGMPECGMYSLIAGLVVFTSIGLALWLVIRDFINRFIND